MVNKKSIFNNLLYKQYKRRLLFLPLALICLILTPVTALASDDDFPPDDWPGSFTAPGVTPQIPPNSQLPNGNNPVDWDDTYYEWTAPDANWGVPVRVTTEPGIRWNVGMHTREEFDRRQEGLDIRGYLPSISPEFSAHIKLNNHIDDARHSLISEARRVRARSITFWYEYHETDSLISIVIFAEVSSVISRTLVYSINFDPFNGNLLTMNQALNMDIIPLAERILTERIRREPESYYAAHSVPLHGRAFFITRDRRLVILFDEFQLSSTRAGFATIELRLDNIVTSTLLPGEYHNPRENGYNLRMIPLGRVVRELGYTATSIQDEQGLRIEVWRGSRLITTMRPGVNDYSVQGFQSRSLESAPYLSNDRTYVPITFFDQILPLTTYTINGGGAIVFLSYLD